MAPCLPHLCQEGWLGRTQALLPAQPPLALQVAHLHEALLQRGCVLNLLQDARPGRSASKDTARNDPVRRLPEMSAEVLQLSHARRRDAQ